MAILERPDMPKSLFGVVGLSPWNILFASILLAYLKERFTSENKITLPSKERYLLVWFVSVILIGFGRQIADLSGIHEYFMYLGELKGNSNVALVRPKDLFFDHILNSLKYAIAALLFYYGIKTEKDVKYALVSVLIFGFLLAIQVVKVMPIDALTDGYILEQTGIRKIDRDIGYYRSDLAILFAGVSWIFVIARTLTTSSALRTAMLFAAGLTTLALALTGGRIGMASWFVVGGIIAFFKMRRLLFLMPILAFAVIYFVPAAQDRFLQGISSDEPQEEIDYSSVTSGRVEIWPHVISKIGESPVLGYGRNGMLRSGLSLELATEIGETFSHPHNAYLQFLLDNGFLFSLPVFYLYFLLLLKSFKMFRSNDNLLSGVVGGAGLIMTLSYMIGYIGLQSFYPNQSITAMWVLLFIMLRVDKVVLSHKEPEREPEKKPMRPKWY
jgi:O-antigen ligase